MHSCGYCNGHMRASGVITCSVPLALMHSLVCIRRLNQKGLYRRQMDSSDEEKERDETEVGGQWHGQQDRQTDNQGRGQQDRQTTRVMGSRTDNQGRGQQDRQTTRGIMQQDRQTDRQTTRGMGGRTGRQPGA